MNLSTEQLAQLLAGIAKSQQAVIDAVDRANTGFRGTYLLPTLNVAANLRLTEVRLLDLPSRILLRSQGRVGMDVETILKNLEEALGAAPNATPSAAPAGGAVTAPAAAAPTAAQAADDLDFFNS